MSDLILPPGVVLTEEGASRPGPPCSVCGEPMPEFTEDQWKEYERLSKVRRVTLRHEVCPRDAGRQRTDRRFEARVAIVEVSLAEGATDATVNELASFIAHTDAPDLYTAMRPLAENLGVKWMEVEEVAHIADPSEPAPAAANTASDPSPAVLSTVKTAHRCGAGEPDYPPQGIVCLCSVGRDHTEAEFAD